MIRLNTILNEGTINEMNPQFNKKVKMLLDKELKDLRKGGGNHLFAVMHILMGALTDANFHSESKKVPALFGSKAKYEGDPMAEKDLIQMYQYDLGTDIANICKWDGKDIVDAIGFYVSMTIGRPMGEKIEKLVESVNEDMGTQLQKIASLTGLQPQAIKQFVSAHELNFTKLLKFIEKGKLSDRIDFVTAVVGNPGNPIQKKMIKMFQESVNEGVRISLFDPNKNKILKSLSVDRNYKEAETEVETLNKRLSTSEKNKGYYWKITTIGESAKEEIQTNEDNPCWKGYQQLGTKKKGGKQVPNCVPKNESIKLMDNLPFQLGKVYSNPYVNAFKSETELKENTSDTYFKSFTDAASAAKAYAIKKGYEINEDDWQTQVALGGKYSRSRPGIGKTHSFTIGLLRNDKPQRKGLNFSVYGMESGKFELTAYVN